jgi:hypothetical protein
VVVVLAELVETLYSAQSLLMVAVVAVVKLPDITVRLVVQVAVLLVVAAHGQEVLVTLQAHHLHKAITAVQVLVMLVVMAVVVAVVLMLSVATKAVQAKAVQVVQVLLHQSPGHR